MSIRNYIPGSVALALFIVLAAVLYSSLGGPLPVTMAGEAPLVVHGLP